MNDLDTTRHSLTGKPIDKSTMSVRLDTGSCLIAYKSPNWSGTSYIVAHPTTKVSNLGTPWNHKISSVERCPRYTRSVQCPVGSYVSSGRVSGRYMDQALKLHCTRPGYPSGIVDTLSSHEFTNQVGGTFVCTELLGQVPNLDFTWDKELECFTWTETIYCSKQAVNCPAGQVIVGMNTEIEKHCK